MSMAIKRASYTGDPGFFDFIKKVATVGTSFIPFVGPQISQTIAGFGGGRQPPVPVAGPGSVPLMPAAVRPSAGFVPCGSGMVIDPRTMKCSPRPQLDVAIPAGGIGAAISRIMPGGSTGMLMPAASAAPMNGSAGGYHLNKSSYFLLSGEYVPAGTRWVKNRKRNPANARATSRAISRITGAKKYASTLGRISIRKKCN